MSSVWLTADCSVSHQAKKSENGHSKEQMKVKTTSQRLEPRNDKVGQQSHSTKPEEPEGYANIWRTFLASMMEEYKNKIPI